MTLPVMKTSDPVTVPAQTIEEKTFDNLWLCDLEIHAEDVNGADASVKAILKPFRDLTDGSKEEAPNDSVRRDVNIENAFAFAQTRAAAGKTALQDALEAVLAAIKEIGIEQGVIAEDIL